MKKEKAEKTKLLCEFKRECEFEKPLKIAFKRRSVIPTRGFHIDHKSMFIVIRERGKTSESYTLKVRIDVTKDASLATNTKYLITAGTKEAVKAIYAKVVKAYISGDLICQI